jgi:hypothetical protein
MGQIQKLLNFLSKQEGTVFAKNHLTLLHFPLRIYGAKNVKNQDFAIIGISKTLKTKPVSDPKREERLREREERFCLSWLGRGIGEH